MAHADAAEKRRDLARQNTVLRSSGRPLFRQIGKGDAESIKPASNSLAQCNDECLQHVESRLDATQSQPK